MATESSAVNRREFLATSGSLMAAGPVISGTGSAVKEPALFQRSKAIH
jgi:hypothetical protein